MAPWSLVFFCIASLCHTCLSFEQEEKIEVTKPWCSSNVTFDYSRMPWKKKWRTKQKKQVVRSSQKEFEYLVLYTSWYMPVDHGALQKPCTIYLFYHGERRSSAEKEQLGTNDRSFVNHISCSGIIAIMSKIKTKIITICTMKPSCRAQKKNNAEDHVCGMRNESLRVTINSVLPFVERGEKAETAQSYF